MRIGNDSPARHGLRQVVEVDKSQVDDTHLGLGLLFENSNEVLDHHFESLQRDVLLPYRPLVSVVIKVFLGMVVSQLVKLVNQFCEL